MNTVAERVEFESGAVLLLADLAEILVGYQARSAIEENLNGPFTIIRGQDFDEEGRLDLDRAMRFSPSGGVDPANYLIEPGDLLIQARGQKHLAYPITEPLQNTVASNTFYIIRIHAQAGMRPEYLAWWLNQPQIQAYFEREQGVSTVPFISKGTLADASIHVPAQHIQHLICELVSLWQRERVLRRLLIDKRERLIHAAARQAVERLYKER